MAKSVAVFVDNGCDKVTVPDLYKSDLTTDSAASQRATGSANGLFDDYFASRSDGGHGRVLSDPQSAFLRTTVLSVITLSDSDDDSEDEGDNDDGMLPIEKKSKKLAQKLKKEAEDSEKEMKLNLAEKEIFTLPSGQDIEKESNQPPDLQILQDRIREVIK